MCSLQFKKLVSLTIHTFVFLSENKMEIKIAELDETISNLKAIISSLEERIVREESDKMVRLLAACNIIIGYAQ